MGYDVLQNGNPEEREVVNGTHDWEGWDFQDKKDTTAGRGGTSTGSWEQSICYFQSVVTVVILWLDRLIMKICFINASWSRIKMSLAS